MTGVLANVGIPMLGIYLPMLLLAFVPIVLIEGFVYRRRLGAGLSTSIKAAAAANLWSTLLGVPLTWLSLVLLQIGLVAAGVRYEWDGFSTTLEYQLRILEWQAEPMNLILMSAWLIPYAYEPGYEAIPVAGLTLVLPFFVASVVVERWSLAGRFRAHDRAAVSRSCWIANGITYLLICLYWGTTLLW